jgi:hypothetical protein
VARTDNYNLKRRFFVECYYNMPYPVQMVDIAALKSTTRVAMVLWRKRLYAFITNTPKAIRMRDHFHSA